MPPSIENKGAAEQTESSQDFSDFSGEDGVVLSEVDKMVHEFEKLYGPHAVEILSSWKFFCHGEIESLRELMGMVAQLIEKFGVESIHTNVLLGIGTWQRITFAQLKFVVTTMCVRSMTDGLYLLRIYADHRVSEEAAAFFWKTAMVHGFPFVRDLAMVSKSTPFKEKLFDAAVEVLLKKRLHIVEFFLMVGSQPGCEESDIADISNTLIAFLNKKELDRSMVFLSRCLHRFDLPRNRYH